MTNDGSPTAILCGVGSSLPATVVTNDDLAARMDTSDEWIVARTGIRRRHVVGAGESTSDLAVRAGAAALKSAQVDSVNVVVLATSTPDHRCPATAPDVAARLGQDRVAAFDVNAVCTGFIYALATAAGLIGTGLAERALVIGADAFSSIVNPRDRGAAVIFGDGAGAVVLRRGTPDEAGALTAFDLGSDGELADLIMVRAGGARQPADAETAEADRWFAMQGRPVYRHAVRRMTTSSRAVLQATGWRADEVDRLVAHQANQRILDAVGAELGLATDAVVTNVERVGNTVAASIPLALADAATAGTLQAGHRVVLTAFGGGATWGSAALVWPSVVAQSEE